MIRIMLFPLLLFTLFMCCTAQTFQYSRGWTNGKRSMGVPSAYYHRNEDDMFQDLYESQDGERKLEKCLIQLQRVLGNPSLLPRQMVRPSLDSSTSDNGRMIRYSRNPSSFTNTNTHNIDDLNNNNNPYSNHHHQSNESEESNDAATNVFIKH